MTLLLLIALTLIIVAVLTTGPAFPWRPRRRVVETVSEEPAVVSETRGDPPLIDRRMLRRRRVG